MFQQFARHTGYLPLLACIAFALAPIDGAAHNAQAVAQKKAKAKKKSKKRAKSPKTQIEWIIKPATVEIHLDGKHLGSAGRLKITRTKPGKHTVRLVNGRDETEFDLEIRKNQSLRFEFTFEP